MTDRERLRKNITILDMHNKTHKSVKKLTYGKKYELELMQEIVDDVASILNKMENKTIIELPCKVGDTVYVITDCSYIMMYYDNDYLTGTGAIECPFEDVCNFTDCNDDNTQVLETYVNYMGIEDGSEWYFRCEHINRANDFNEIGKTVFLTKEEAEEKLKELG